MRFRECVLISLLGGILRWRYEVSLPSSSSFAQRLSIAGKGGKDEALPQEVGWLPMCVIALNRSAKKSNDERGTSSIGTAGYRLSISYWIARAIANIGR